MLNAGIAGDTVETLLYRVQYMNLPPALSHITILCGTNNLSFCSPATISATIIELIFLLRKKCPHTRIHLFPILPRFGQLQVKVSDTNFHIHFQVQEQFFHDNFVQFHFLPTALYHRQLYREDKLHLTSEGCSLLV